MRTRSSARWLWLGLLLVLFAPAAAAQQQAPEGTPISRVEIRGLETISESFVRRTIRTRAGQNYIRSEVQQDVRELLRTRKFLNVIAEALLEENQAVVIFTLQEKPEIIAIEIEGNKRFSNEDLFKELTITPNTPLDRYEINRSLENIVQKYKQAGYYYVQVTLDESLLQRENRVLYRVTEGPRVKVRRIELEGNRSLPEIQLRLRIRSQTYLWILRTGAFDEETAERDALELQTLYRNEGFLDARVGYRLDFSSVDRSDLTLVFVIEEGPRYRVNDFRFEGNEVFSDDRLRSAIQLAPGDFARDEAVRTDLKRIRDLYGEIGYVDARAENDFEYLEEPGLVNLVISIFEGRRSKIGRITIRGNKETKDEVVRRELRFYPGEDFNTVKTARAEQRLIETGLFTKATVTPLPDDDGVREALIEVEEADAINFIVGFGVSTDSGVIGTFSIDNRNFDLFDLPRGPGEFFRGKAFRGAGQRLRLVAEPGTEVNQFRIDFTEPYLLDRPLRFDMSLYLFQRGRDAYDEQRLGVVPSLGRRFESGLLAGWAIEGALRLESIDITDVEPLAANDILASKGNSTLTAVKGTIVRDTTDSRLLPTEGYRLSMSWEQVGALGGDYHFAKPAVGFAWFKTLSTDVLDRKSVLGLRADAAWIVGDAPVFERFYAGGFGSLRGFDYRGVSPRAGIFNNRVGGDFILLTGAEYSFPIYAKNVRGVTFLDMGTVEENFEITAWRASVGVGLRITVDFFGPVPIVLDFGFPIADESEDDTRVFNFNFGASF